MWISGRTDSARERITRAVVFAQDSKRPYDLATALLFKGLLAQVSERTAAGRGYLHSTVILIRGRARRAAWAHWCGFDPICARHPVEPKTHGGAMLPEAGFSSACRSGEAAERLLSPPAPSGDGTPRGFCVGDGAASWVRTYSGPVDPPHFEKVTGGPVRPTPRPWD
jgi:hypothetical protein